MKRVFGVDPGDKHVGFCEARTQADGTWEVYAPVELSPPTFVRAVTITDPDLIVLESYRVYSDKAMQHIGSEVPTAEMIGYVKWLRYQRGLSKPIMQSASIKKPTEGWMDLLNIRHQAVTKRRGGHAKDAETHIYHYLMRTLKVDPANIKQKDEPNAS